MHFWFPKRKKDNPSSSSSSELEPRVQKWRDYFVQHEAEQLHHFPLSHLESPLERAQYEVAMHYFRKKWRVHRKRVVALCADEATRRAFFDFHGPNRNNWFCFRNGDDWESLLANWHAGHNPWPFQTHYHEFLDCRSREAHQIPFNNDALNNFQEGSHFLRHYGYYDAGVMGSGGYDIWHWNGTSLLHLPRSGSSWIS